MKSTTERDLTRLKSELSQTARTMQTACFNFNASVKSTESQGQVSDEKRVYFFFLSHKLDTRELSPAILISLIFASSILSSYVTISLYLEKKSNCALICQSHFNLARAH